MRRFERLVAIGLSLCLAAAVGLGSYYAGYREAYSDFSAEFKSPLSESITAQDEAQKLQSVNAENEKSATGSTKL